MKSYEVVLDREAGLTSDMIEAENKTELYKILKERYPEDIGADAVGYDENGEEFGIHW